MGIMDGIVIQWTIRRLLEVGGWLSAIVSIVVALPPEHQATIVAVLTGQGGGLTISAAIGLGVYFWSQFLSFRSTVRPQLVTEVDGRTVQITTERSSPQSGQPARRRTLLDVLLGR